MKIRVFWIGKTGDGNLARLVSDYASRIERFLPLEIIEAKEPRVHDAKRIDSESEKILASLDSSDRMVLLDPVGKEWTSPQFAQMVARHMREDPRRLTFVIGGFNGVSAAVKKRADVVWSLSPLTFTHDLCRVLLLEQIYRALSTIHNHPYSR